MKIVEIMVQITQNTYGNGGALKWAVMESGCESLVLRPNKILLKALFLRYQPNI